MCSLKSPRPTWSSRGEGGSSKDDQWRHPGGRSSQDERAEIRERMKKLKNRSMMSSVNPLQFPPSTISTSLCKGFKVCLKLSTIHVFSLCVIVYILIVNQNNILKVIKWMLCLEARGSIFPPPKLSPTRRFRGLPYITSTIFAKFQTPLPPILWHPSWILDHQKYCSYKQNNMTIFNFIILIQCFNVTVVFSVGLSLISISLRSCLWRPSDSLRTPSDSLRRLSEVRGSPETII